MKRRVLFSTAAAALTAAAAYMTPAAAQSAETASVADTWWAFHGNVEAGGRFFLNNPGKDGVASQGQTSLGKYYEYSDIRPGPFTDGWLNFGSKDGLWNVDLWADNVGYNDQRFEVNGSKAGEYYVGVGWDQTPHIYSTNAQTLYNGVGTTTLTLPAGLSNTLFKDAGCTRVAGKPPTGCTNATLPGANATAVQRDITNNLHTTDIGIRRDTATVDFRWTPTTAWDIHVDYSNMHRWGTQVEGVVFSPGATGVTAQVPKPVDDTTQNFGINGEYQGTAPWGKLFTVKLGYAGSVYQDASSSYSVENPFCGTGSGPGECARGGTTASNGSPSSPFATMGLWPDNQAHGFTSTLGADLPAKSRYMGTLAYTMMRQNESFIPFTSAATVYNGGTATPYASMGAPPTLPASSLNGQINTFLSNNVVTTQITPEFKSKFSYRYYDFDNQTPELLFPDWVVTDTKLASSTSASYTKVHSLSVSYTKQNGGADLDWRPSREWNLGVGYGYERYNWTRADADVTNEHTGKAFVDWKPWIWLATRASWSYSDRMYDNYNSTANSIFQWASTTCAAANCNTISSTAMRQFYLDNRARSKGQFSVAIDVIRGLTVTPTFGYQVDDYSISATELGLSRSQAVRAGIELAYAVNPSTTFLLSYMNEQYQQNLKYTSVTGTAALTPANTFHTDVIDRVNTFMGGVNWRAIPDKLDMKLSYTMSLSKSSGPQYSDSGAQPSPQYPDIKGQWQRLEAQAKYTFDKDAVRVFGIKGTAYAKLRYVWERNSVDNFDQDIMQAYMNSVVGSTGFMTWMAYDNPNYNAHLIGASLGVKW